MAVLIQKGFWMWKGGEVWGPGPQSWEEQWVLQRV